MTPAARLAAAIELYGDIMQRRLAADRAIGGWFRGRRYAGSGDRRAITALVYDALRRSGELRWRVGDGAPRLVVMAASGESVERLDVLCDGSKFAPAALTDEERAILGQTRAGEMPPHAALNYPAWLHDEFVARFGDALGEELGALAGRAAVDLRVNTLKATRDAVLARLAAEGIAASATPFAPTGIRLGEAVRLDKHELMESGQVEPQDEAAQLATMLVQAEPGMTVIDLCAGAGGKTLGLASTMNNQGRLLAFDRDARRLNRLAPRAERAGVSIVETPADQAGLAGTADRVLLDVPCSGTGTWRRNPEARWHLDAGTLAHHRHNQAALLDEGAALVAPGGRLVYATCSLLPVEDEGAVDAFLARNPGFARLDAAEIAATVTGATPPFSGPDMLLTPLRHGTDGFFCALLQRLN